MKTEVQELLMELSGAMKRQKLEQVAAQLLNPESGWKHDDTLQELASLHLRIASLDELAQRLARAPEGQFADLRLALDALSKAPALRYRSSVFYVGAARPALTPEQTAAEAKRVQEEEEHAVAYRAVRAALQKVGEK